MAGPRTLKRCSPSPSPGRITRSRSIGYISPNKEDSVITKSSRKRLVLNTPLPIPAAVVDQASDELVNLHLEQSFSNEIKCTTASSHASAVKSAFHFSAVPETILCRNLEIEKVMNFCKAHILDQQPGSLYVCGCPGTGKSLTMEKLKLLSVEWAREARMLPPDLLAINCTTLKDPQQIYRTILESVQPDRVGICSEKISAQQFKHVFSTSAPLRKMQLLVVDEMDYLITRNQTVLYDLFQLTVYHGSSCILIGIANAIDLTERLLPRLKSFNCNPDVVTFPAYSKDQILTVLKQRLESLPFPAFHATALEFCARKVSAASGDMRKALHACRTSFEILLCELKERNEEIEEQQNYLVQIKHMSEALSKTFRSPVIETIQALPNHSQMVLCAAVQMFKNGKKDASLGDLNKRYVEFCKTRTMSAVSCQEFSGICQVLADQGLFSLSAAREDRLKKAKLQVDKDDVLFALQGIRFFRNSLS